MVPGGSALNQGRHLHALGMQVRFVGAVGCSEIEVRKYQTMINDMCKCTLRQLPHSKRSRLWLDADLFSLHCKPVCTFSEGKLHAFCFQISQDKSLCSRSSLLRLARMRWVSLCSIKSRGRAFQQTRLRCLAICPLQFALSFLAQLIVLLYLAIRLRMLSLRGISGNKLKTQCKCPGTQCLGLHEVINVTGGRHDSP